jgi:pSer/pThr/pTyr-binding forkhead associated (FHA) protein
VRIDDPGVSRRHAEFRVLGEGEHADVVVVDLRSTNGTVVDGIRVAQAPVRDGSTVTVGSTTIVVRHHDPRRGG